MFAFDEQAIITAVPEMKIVAPVPWEKVATVNSCNDCSFESSGKCLLTGKSATKRCNRFESIDDTTEAAYGAQEAEVDVEPAVPDLSEYIAFDGEPSALVPTDEEIEEALQNCTTCAYAMYKDGQPWCRLHSGIISMDDLSPCDNYALEGSIVIIEEQGAENG
jgi:hypothetical protein